MFEYISFFLDFWFVFQLRVEQLNEEAKLTFTNKSVYDYMIWSGKSHISAPYFNGTFLILAILRFFFSLKATRLFGPFTKIVQLNAGGLLVWVLFSSLLIVLAGNYLTILLQ